MNYDVNKCSEYAMKDSKGEKLDVKTLNTAIEAVKSGSVPYFASIGDIPIVEGAPQIPNVFGFENAIAMKFDQNSFVTFYIEDDGNIHTINHSYNTQHERWNEYIIYEDMYLTDLGGTKLYKHTITKKADSAWPLLYLYNILSDTINTSGGTPKEIVVYDTNQEQITTETIVSRINSAITADLVVTYDYGIGNVKFSIKKAYYAGMVYFSITPNLGEIGSGPISSGKLYGLSSSTSSFISPTLGSNVSFNNDTVTPL